MSFFKRKADSFSPTQALQPGGMISVLFDYQNLAERGMVANDLSFFNERIVWEALLHIACDEREPIELRETCGESLGEIFWRNKIYDAERVKQMTPEAKTAFDAEYGVLIKAAPNGPPDVEPENHNA